jgi:hypothetical protein
MDTNGRCCVFQPFDKGPFDKRYDDTIAPAVKAAGLEPYRVDRDDGVVIPIETLHEEIRSAVICLADISTQNPNVMYELGFAIASGKDVVLVCSTQRSKPFPFDIRHRGIIEYASDSARDFEKLKNDITNRIKALLKKQAATDEIASASPVKGTHGLQPHEVAALAFVMANADGVESGVSAYSIKADMERAGYTNAATQLGLIRLSRLGYVESVEESDSFRNESWIAYRLTTAGQDWLLENQDQLEMRLSRAVASAPRPLSETGITDDDVPF